MTATVRTSLGPPDYKRLKVIAAAWHFEALDWPLGSISPVLGRPDLKIDPKSIEFEEGFSRDVSTVGHYGTGDLELTLGGHADLEKARALICQSYELF